jgi:O-antigen/teichoic acid export membrane protein
MKNSLSYVIGRGTLWYSVNTYATKIIGLATLFFILRQLSVYEYGLVELALSVVATLSIFRLPGIGSVVIADMGEARGRGDLSQVKTLFTSYVRLQFFLSFVAWAVVFFGATLIAQFYKGQIADLVKLTSFLFFTSVLRAAYTTLFSVHLKYFTQSFHTFLEEVSKLLFVLLFFFVFESGPSGIVLATIFSQLLPILLLLPSFLKLYMPLARVQAVKSTVMRTMLLGHGKWSLFSSYLNDFGQSMRVWLIGIFLGTEAVGLFSVAQGLYSHTVSLIPISQVVTPLLPQYLAQKEKFEKIFTKSVKYQFFGFTALGIFAYFAFTPLIAYLFPLYRDALPLFHILLLALPAISVASLLTPVFFALKAQRSFFFSIFVKTLAMVVLLPVGAIFFGLKGVAVEFILTVYIVTLERMFALKKNHLPHLSLSPKELITFDSYDAVVLQRIKGFLRI